MNEDLIRTEDVPQCPLCGNEERRILYAALRDRLFGAPGEWTFKECCHCGLVFLDPRPTPEDVEKAYATYYTHFSAPPLNGFLRRVRQYVRGGYLATKFGYTAEVTQLQRLMGWLAYLHPGQREMMNISVMYLPAKHRGRLLEVGFGSGETLAEMRRLGWEVEGIDFDAQAVKNARHNYDLNVRAGHLENQAYPPHYFDSVIMNHVIEHVHNPLQLLRECRRILKPGGVLVIVTPNVKSRLHRRFKHNWRGLEPPRHLTIFSMYTMSLLAGKVQLKLEELRSTVRGAGYILAASREISTNGSFTWQAKLPKREKIRAHTYQYLMSAALRVFPEDGEELVMVAVKDE